jgi:arabinofuranosyltransferase
MKRIAAIITAKWLWISLGLVSSTFFLYYLFEVELADDAWITFRYARNLVNGYGFVYNPGGERVEGYTNFLWLLLSAIGIRFGIHPLALTKLAGLCCVFATAYICYVIASRYRHLWNNIQAVPFILMGLMIPYSLWSVSGLETAFTALLMTSVLLIASKESDNELFLYGIVLAFLLLNRQDGIVALSAICLMVISDWYIDKRTGFKGLVHRFFKLSIPILIIYLPYFLWRYQYFGFIFPNTYYAKVHNFDFVQRILLGFHYTLAFMRDWGAIPLLFIVIYPFWNSRWFTDRVLRAGYLLVIMHIAYVIYVGGDVLPVSRFFVPVVPIIAVLATISIVETVNRLLDAEWRKAIVIGLVVIITATISIQSFDALQLNNQGTLNLAKKLAVADEPLCPFCNWLAAYAPPQSSIALFRAGYIPYYTDFFTIDRIGLNDVYIAHHGVRDDSFFGREYRTTLDYWLSQTPTFIETHFNAHRLLVEGEQGIVSISHEDIALFEHEIFLENYALLNLTGDLANDTAIFQRIDTVDPLCLEERPNFRLPICNIQIDKVAIH